MPAKKIKPPPDKRTLVSFYGAPVAGPPTADATFRDPATVYRPDTPLNLLPPSFLAPVRGWLPCLRLALRLQARHHTPSPPELPLHASAASASAAPPAPAPPSALPLLAQAHASSLSIYPLHLCHSLCQHQRHPLMHRPLCPSRSHPP